MTRLYAVGRPLGPARWFRVSSEDDARRQMMPGEALIESDGDELRATISADGLAIVPVAADPIP